MFIARHLKEFARKNTYCSKIQTIVLHTERRIATYDDGIKSHTDV